MNREQREIEKKNKKVYEMVGSEHWTIIKELIFEEINDLQSVMNIEGEDADAIFLDLKVRKNLINSLADIVRKIEGQADQYEQNELSPEESELSHIMREEDDE